MYSKRDHCVGHAGFPRKEKISPINPDRLLVLRIGPAVTTSVSEYWELVRAVP